MRQIAVRGALGVIAVLVLALSACSSSIDNGMDTVPLVHITESARTPLTAGAVGSTGITVTDDSSGASVDIPPGTVITLDASDSDDISAVIPESIVVALRPISQFLAAQNGDLLTADGLNLPDLTKVGALAVLPIDGRCSVPVTLTVPVAASATGDVTIWHFVPDDNPNGDGVLTALPTIGHWRFLASGTVDTGKVTFSSDTFGQFLITTLAGGGGGGPAPTVTLTADKQFGANPLAVNFTATATDDGTIAKYEWDFDGDGTFDTTTTVGTTTQTYSTDGQFFAAVRVTDDEGETGTDSLQINVGDTPPTIGALDPLTATTGVAQTFTLTATDPDTDGSIVKYEWDFANDGTYEVDTAAVNSTSFTFDTAGTQTIGVRVTDDKGGTATQTFDIVIDAAGGGPTATLTPNPTAGPLNETNELPVTFTTVIDPDTTTVTKVEYKFDDVDDFVEDTEADPLTTTHTYTEVGSHNATVRITPDAGDPFTATTTVIVTTSAGGPSATLTPSANPVALNGSNEAAVDFTTTLTPDTTSFTKIEYKFEDADEFVEDTDDPVHATHVYTAAGDHVATVRVTPTTGDPFTSTVTVTVTETAGAPTATLDATPNPATLNAGTAAVDFTTTLTPDTTQVSIVVYNFGDGTSPVTESDITPLTSTHNYTDSGTFHPVVTVFPSGGGDPITATTDVVVNAAGGENQPPVAAFTATPVLGNPMGFNLDAAASSDPESGDLTFSWDWDNDGTPDSTEQSTTVIYPAADADTDQTIKLTVTDDHALSTTTQRVVHPTAP